MEVNLLNALMLQLKRKVSLRTVSHVTFTWGVLYTDSLPGLAFAGGECVPR